MIADFSWSHGKLAKILEEKKTEKLDIKLIGSSTFWQSYLWNPYLDRYLFIIYYSSPHPLKSEWSDLLDHFPFKRNFHKKYSGKKHPTRQSRLSVVLVLFRHWIKLLFGYVVRLVVLYILNNGDRK